VVAVSPHFISAVRLYKNIVYEDYNASSKMMPETIKEKNR
jgi:hypothetical protein